MPEEIKPAESSPATQVPAESRPAEASTAQPTTVSFTEVLKDSTSEERREWEKTGDDTALYDKVEKRKAEAKPAASEPESAPGTTSEEQKKQLTPEERSERDRTRGDKRQGKYWRDRAVEERTRRLELERRFAENQQKTPEAAPGAVQANGRPRRPRISDTKYQVDNGAELYDADMERYEDTLLSHRDSQREAVQEQSRTQADADEELRDLRGTWQRHEALIAKEFPDYAALMKTLPGKLDNESPALADAISRIPEGPRLMVYFGKEHPEEWDRLVDLPIPEALMELGLIRKSLKPAPQPNTNTKAPAPVHAATGRDQVEPDPIEAARQKGDWATYERLANEADLREWGLLT